MRAFADPTRLVIVDALDKGGEVCVCDLAWITGRAQNLVSHHLRSLKGEGLAKARREGKIVFYSLTDHGVRLYAFQCAAENLSCLTGCSRRAVCPRQPTKRVVGLTGPSRPLHCTERIHAFVRVAVGRLANRRANAGARRLH
jgi:DNA-binding transcriptional ArsR family regulator